jgi:hypothetical protein
LERGVKAGNEHQRYPSGVFSSHSNIRNQWGTGKVVDSKKRSPKEFSGRHDYVLKF